jgi:predicted acylesterase/phospholipase RssA
MVSSQKKTGGSGNDKKPAASAAPEQSVPSSGVVGQEPASMSNTKSTQGTSTADNAPSAASYGESTTDEAKAADAKKKWDAAFEALAGIRGAPTPQPKDPGLKRAICLGGGGPALGLHIGALEGMREHNIDFRHRRSVWALSCIGAWVGILYNQAKYGNEIEETYRFFRDVFRDDESYQSFPLNTIFAPDWAGCAEAALNYMLKPDNWRNAVLPRHMMESLLYTLSHLRQRKNWGRFNEGDFNRWTFNHVLAVHPVVRFMTGLLYMSELDGRARLHYKDSKFLNDIKFKRLDEDYKPYIFYNAFNFRRNDIDLFANNPRSERLPTHKAISPESLCACSALPFVEKTVRIGNDAYCEGALVDTVNFKSLLADHHKGKKEADQLKEIWINRIVDMRQIRQPLNQHDALGNLCQMFAATVGEDDIRLFKFHARQNNRRAQQQAGNPQTRLPYHALKKDGTPEQPLEWRGIIVEVPVDGTINYEWSHSNLERSRERGRVAARAVCKLYEKYGKADSPDQVPEAQWNDGVLVIPEDLTDDEIKKVLTGDELAVVMRSRRRTSEDEANIRAVLASMGLTEDRLKALPRGR